jgi:hypothetical protein
MVTRTAHMIGQNRTHRRGTPMPRQY